MAATPGGDSADPIHLEPSMSRKGNCWDNAVAESFCSSLKKERITKQIYKNRELAASRRGRLHRCLLQSNAPPSHLGDVRPEEFDAAHKPRRKGVH